MTDNRKNITQPADWWAAFERAASLEGETLSEWLGKAGLERLTKAERKKLSDRKPAHRPKNSPKKD